MPTLSSCLRSIAPLRQGDIEQKEPAGCCVRVPGRRRSTTATVAYNHLVASQCSTSSFAPCLVSKAIPGNITSHPVSHDVTLSVFRPFARDLYPTPVQATFAGRLSLNIRGRLRCRNVQRKPKTPSQSTTGFSAALQSTTPSQRYGCLAHRLAPDLPLDKKTGLQRYPNH